MKIVDCWLFKGKTAVYCNGDDVDEFAKKKTVIIANHQYSILGHDILISPFGNKNLMLLLDTTEQFEFP
ncbi:MAG: hypothetical protein IIT39_04785, partial [Clostridia bacterium]|nr:hypothetical protein [Clostridia bacterium]